jgi:drug/metabolite transporter (DMT)-like permease
MFSALCLLSLPGLISSFSHPSHSASLGFPKIRALRQRSYVPLFAIPTRSEKKHTHAHNKESSLGFVAREQDSLFGENIEQFDLELARQKLEFEKLEFESFVTNHKDHELLEEIVSHETSSGDSLQTRLLSPVWQARLLLMVAAALYGTNFTFVKILNENVPVQFGTSLRFALAACATIPFLFFKNKSQNESFDANAGIDTSMLSDNGVILGGMEVGMWNAIGYLSQAVGLETTPASTSAFVCSLAVVVVPVLDYLAGKKIITREVLGALLAVAGVAFLELDGFQGSLVAGNGISISSGDLFTLVQPLAFGLGFWRMEHYMRKFPTSAMKLTASQLTTIASVSIGVAMVTSPGDLPDFAQVSEWLSNPTILGSILWTGLITTALTVAMETFALKTLSAAEATMLFSTEPIFGGICASYVLGEQFGVGGLVGSAMVLGGCLYSKLGAVKVQETSV